MPDRFPKICVWDDLREGARDEIAFIVSARDMSQFQQLSGDKNPLHADDQFARDKGFEGVVVFGGLLVAKVSNFVGMRLPGRDSVWTKFDIQFHKPLYVNQEARIEGVVCHLSEAARSVGVKITIRRSGELIAKGLAEIHLV